MRSGGTYDILLTRTQSHTQDTVIERRGIGVGWCQVGSGVYPHANSSGFLIEEFVVCLFEEMQHATASGADEAFGVGDDAFDAVTRFTTDRTRGPSA